MARGNSDRRLVVNADDFGGSRSVNEAVIRAHREGILTTASLMVNGSAAAEAIALAQANPRLGVGLHLVLVCGASSLQHEKIAGLTNSTGRFSESPVAAGLRYFFCRGLQDELFSEIDAQFEEFRRTGLFLDHVNGHLNMHLHPVILDLLIRHADRWGIERMRLTHDPLAVNRRLAPGRWGYRLAHAFIFHALSSPARRRLHRCGITHTDRVFGLLQNGSVDEEYVYRLLDALPDGTSELYSHPSTEKFKHEMDALISPRVKSRVGDQGIHLVRYQDLS